MELSSLDIRYAVEELQSFVGSKIEKIFQSDTNKKDVFFHVYTGNGKRNLRFILPGIVCAPKEKGNYPIAPPGFAMFLRKYLDGARITSISQAGFDRIINIDFSKRDQEYRLVLEFMPPGNMMLLDKEGKIINVLENQQYKDRALKPRQEYSAPPATFNIVDESSDSVAQRIVETTRDSIVTTLATRMGLGGLYAEEACHNAGIDKRRNDLTAEEIAKITAAVKDLALKPIAAHKDENRAYPFKPATRDTTQCEETSFLGAICEFVVENQMTRQETKQKERSSPQNKLQSLIDAQRKQAERLEESARDDQRKGELIYENYILVKEILDAAKEAKTKKNDVRKAHKGIISYNEATTEIEIEIEENNQ